MFDPRSRTLSWGTAATFHEGNEGWLKRIFAIAAALQVAMPHALMGSALPTAAIGMPDHTPHPRNGARPDLDDMLNLHLVTRDAGTRPCLITKRHLAEAAGILRDSGFDAAADGSSLVVNLPMERSRGVAQIQLDLGRHPDFGNGLLTLVIPPQPAVPDMAAYANNLNLAELTDAPDQHVLGAWLAEPKGGLRHVGFITADVLAALEGGYEALLVNVALNEVIRLRWLEAQAGA